MPLLQELRAAIDLIDDDIARLLNKRADLVLEVKKAKEKENVDIYSPAREREILQRVSKLLPEGRFPRGALERIFGSIISATRSLIGQLNVCFVGLEGSPAHAAAVKQFGENLSFKPLASTEQVIAQLVAEDAHYGVVPARSAGGNLDRASRDGLFNSSLNIIAEVEVPASSTSTAADLQRYTYYVVGREAAPASSQDKTVLVCQVQDRPGALREVLRPFEEAGLTLLRIESELQGPLCVFTLEVLAHKAEEGFKAAFADLQRQSGEAISEKGLRAGVKVLGSFPVIPY